MNNVAYSTSTPTNNRETAARMAAAARTSREREAFEAKAEHCLRLEEAEFGKATRVGFKVIEEAYGKYRYSVSREEAAASIARHWRDGDEVEFWTIRD